ncbi:ribosome maturation factor RimP [Actinomycetospora sp. OC33-EN08]|uniref:Ribosome maturation factor RimP n=1 Tax=Actinomycetospora aurantiaca TaxID=3129233 RepID=A0ABU8MLL6_9PSEU
MGSPTGAAATALTPVVADVVERAGFVLDDLDVRPAGRRHVVRVTVDTPDAPAVDDGPAGGVDLDAVAAISRDVSAAVDAHEEAHGAVLGEYTLEVSTPGTDRPLTEPRHWRKAWLRRVAVTLDDGTKLSGRVGAVTDSAVTLAVGKGLQEVPLDRVERAGIEVEFKPASDAQVEALRADRTDKETR